jgi:hypothetical protein
MGTTVTVLLPAERLVSEVQAARLALAQAVPPARPS